LFTKNKGSDNLNTSILFFSTHKCMWMYLIICVAVKQADTGIAEDVRSDDEDDITEVGSIKNKKTK